jgi:hypothetical protein
MDVTHFSDSDLDLMNKIIGFDGDKSATIKVKRPFIKRAIAFGESEDAASRNAEIIRTESLVSILVEAEYIELSYSTRHLVGANRFVTLKAKGISAFSAGGFKAVQQNQRWEKRKKDLAFWFSVVALAVSLLTFAVKLPSIIREWQDIYENVPPEPTSVKELPEAPPPVEPAVVYERVVGQSKNETRSSGDSAIADE